MRVLLSIAVLIAPLGTANAQFVPRSPPSGDRMPGIVDRGTTPAQPTIGRELLKSRNQIRQGQKDGDLSKREARALRREARQIDALADRYSADGLSDSERRELDMRVRALQSLTAAQRTTKPLRAISSISLKNGAAGQD